MSRPRFLADNDLNDAIVLGVLRRAPAIEFKRLRDRGLETFCRDNDRHHRAHANGATTCFRPDRVLRCMPWFGIRTHPPRGV